MLCSVLRAITLASLLSIPIQGINGDKIYDKPLILVNPNTPESEGKGVQLGAVKDSQAQFQMHNEIRL